MRSTWQPRGREIDALDGFPPTRWTRDRNGEPALEVQVNALTPLRAKVADGLAVGSCAALAVGWLYGAANSDAESMEYLVSLFGPIALYVPARYLYRAAFAKETRVLFTKTTLEVRTAFGTKIYDRLANHAYEYDEHWYARYEREKHEIEMRRAELRRNPARPTRYFSESYHLTYRHRNQRRTIASVFAHPYDAQAYIDRFYLCDEEMNKLLHREQDGWRPAPGDVGEFA